MNLAETTPCPQKEAPRYLMIFIMFFHAIFLTFNGFFMEMLDDGCSQNLQDALRKEKSASLQRNVDQLRVAEEKVKGFETKVKKEFEAMEAAANKEIGKRRQARVEEHATAEEILTLEQAMKRIDKMEVEHADAKNKWEREQGDQRLHFWKNSCWRGQESVGESGSCDSDKDGGDQGDQDQGGTLYF